MCWTDFFLRSGDICHHKHILGMHLYRLCRISVHIFKQMQSLNHSAYTMLMNSLVNDLLARSLLVTVLVLLKMLK